MHRTRTRHRPAHDDRRATDRERGAWRDDGGATPSWLPLVGSFAILALMLVLVLVLSAVR